MSDRNEQAEYYDDVKSMAQSFVDEIASKDITDRDDLIERIDQDIDGSARVIYTWKAKMCVVYSDNDTAYFDDFGSDGAISDSGIEWSKLAYCAFRADVLAELERLGVDVNADAWPFGLDSAGYVCDECDSRITLGDDEKETSTDHDLTCSSHPDHKYDGDEEDSDEEPINPADNEKL